MSNLAKTQWCSWTRR